VVTKTQSSPTAKQRQASLAETLRAKSAVICDAEAQLLESTTLPPYLLTQPAWTTFIKCLTGATELPSRSTVTRKMDADYARGKSKIAEVLFCSNEPVAIAFDNWDDKRLGEYCGIIFRTFYMDKMVSGLASLVPIHRGLLCLFLLHIIHLVDLYIDTFLSEMEKHPCQQKDSVKLSRMSSVPLLDPQVLYMMQQLQWRRFCDAWLAARQMVERM